MSKHTITQTGLNITKTGKLQYPKELNAYGGSDETGTGWSLNENELKVNQRIWNWSYNRRMSKNNVGTVIDSATPLTKNKHFDIPRRKALPRMKNLNGDIVVIWDNLILTEDQFNEAKSIL